ncbi:MAG: hypothetical protein PVH70_17355, partial [Desulfobacterales bacterium]
MLSSFIIYALIMTVSGQVEPRGVLMSLMIPAIISPFFTYAFINGASKLARSKAALQQSEEKYRAIL